MEHSEDAGAASGAPVFRPFRTVIEGGYDRNVSHTNYVTRQPLVPEVLGDLDRCIARFEAGGMRSFAAFVAVAAEMCIVELFDTASAKGRHSRHESPATYAELLFEAVVRRMTDVQNSFDARLGALYLLFTLHEAQPIDGAVVRKRMSLHDGIVVIIVLAVLVVL